MLRVGVTLHCVASHCFDLICIALHCTLHCPPLHCCALLCFALRRCTLHRIASHSKQTSASVHTHRLQQMETQFRLAKRLRCWLRTRTHTHTHTHKPTSTLTLKHTKPFQATPSVFAQATHCHPHSSVSTPQCFPPSIHQARPTGNTSRHYICNDECPQFFAIRTLPLGSNNVHGVTACIPRRRRHEERSRWHRTSTRQSDAHHRDGHQALFNKPALPTQLDRHFAGMLFHARVRSHSLRIEYM